MKQDHLIVIFVKVLLYVCKLTLFITAAFYRTIVTNQFPHCRIIEVLFYSIYSKQFVLFFPFDVNLPLHLCGPVFYL